MGKPHQPYQGPHAHDVLSHIAQDIIDYVDWYCEHGLFLPEKYAKDPATWAQILRDIQAAMRILRARRQPETLEEEELLYDGIEKYYQYSRYLFKP